VSVVETKAVEILGKFLKKEKDLMDKILEKDYKWLNRIFDIAQIKYGERPLPTYTRTLKPSIENVTKKKELVVNLARKLRRRRRLLHLLVMKNMKEMVKKWVQRLLAS
jgi:predicted metal-dependent RNase